ncbi:unnamed protein product [Effrenium voratum]|uniref:Uncharacterized protein n=1 Tax=Effrenium voratum TaxID=2562239 RepID=A0AA36MXC7_9DINO|nr:unnamed protein product [Effrenium voratum]
MERSEDLRRGNYEGAQRRPPARCAPRRVGAPGVPPTGARGGSGAHRHAAPRCSAPGPNGTNGRAGEVLSRVADDQGFLLVRVQLPEGAKNMKIQPRCLKPIRHPKDGRPRGGRLTGFVDMYHDHPEAAASVVSSRPPTARSALSAAASSVLRQNPAEETSRLV